MTRFRVIHGIIKPDSLQCNITYSHSQGLVKYLYEQMSGRDGALGAAAVSVCGRACRDLVDGSSQALDVGGVDAGHGDAAVACHVDVVLLCQRVYHLWGHAGVGKHANLVSDVLWE